MPVMQWRPRRPPESEQGQSDPRVGRWAAARERRRGAVSFGMLTNPAKKPDEITDLPDCIQKSVSCCTTCRQESVFGIMEARSLQDAAIVLSADGQEAHDASQRSGSIAVRTHRRKRGIEEERNLLEWIPLVSGITSNESGSQTQHQQNDRLLRTTLLYRELEVRTSDCKSNIRAFRQLCCTSTTDFNLNPAY